MTFHRLQVVATDHLLSELADEVLHTATRLGAEVVLVKYAALRRAGLVASGERHARDLDLLTDTDSAHDLQRALIAQGFRPSSRSSELHLPPLQRRPGEVIEIHKALWGVRVPDSERRLVGASVSSLLRGGFVKQLPDGSQVPTRSVMGAHAIVHGLVQHRTAPEGYPVMRVMADLCALNLNEDDGEQCQHFSAGAIDAAQTRTALRLSRALGDGVELTELANRPKEFELLGHVIAASTDKVYREALRFERIAALCKFETLRRTLWASLSNSSTGSVVEPHESWLRGSIEHARPVRLALELIQGARSYVRTRRRTHGD